MLLQGNQGQTGKQVGQNLTAGFGEYSDVLVTELQPRYYENIYRGNAYFLSAASANPTAYSGAAAGTPLLALYNPLNSGKNLWVIATYLAQQTTGTAAAAEDFSWYGGQVAVLGTGTVTTPYNLLTLQQSGSAVKGFVNTALTSQTFIGAAAALINPILSIGAIPTTTATLQTWTPAMIEEAGLICCVPGNLIAIGAAASLTAAKIDASVKWIELSV